jgi:hypothetical protein
LDVVLQPYLDENIERVSIVGPEDVLVPASSVTSMAMILHDRLGETGRGPTTRPRRNGFGTKLVARTIEG